MVEAAKGSSTSKLNRVLWAGSMSRGLFNESLKTGKVPGKIYLRSRTLQNDPELLSSGVFL
jgi:hypothetical protein